MRHKDVWKRLGAWTLAFSMVAGSCPSMALAEEADQQIVDVEEFSDQEQAGEVSQAEEMPSGETSVEDVEDVPEDSFTAAPADESTEEPAEFTCEEVEDVDLLSDNAGEPAEGENPAEGEEPDDGGFVHYELYTEYASGDWHMFPGSEMKIFTSVSEWYDDNEGDGGDGEVINLAETKPDVDTGNGDTGNGDAGNGDGENTIEYELELYNGLKDGTAYDSSLIDVTINPKDNSLLVKAKEGAEGGTDICIQAVAGTGEERRLLATNQVWVEVRSAYDVLAPQKLLDDNSELGAGKQLYLSGLQVLHYTVGAEVPQVREDVRFRLVEPDENMWYVKKNVSEGATDFPIVYRKTADHADLYIAAEAKNDAGEWEEICSRDYSFDCLDYDMYFENLRGDEDDGNYTFVYDNEVDYYVGLNTENLDNRGENYSVRWSVGKIQEDTEEDSFIPYTGTDETAFWKSEGNKLYIDGARFAKAYQELEEGWHFVIRTKVVGYIPGESDEPQCEFVLYTDEAGLDLAESWYEYHFENDYRSVLVDQNIWINKEGECYIEDADHPEGNHYTFRITGVELEGNDDIFEVTEPDGGWNLYAKRPGQVTAKISYNDYYGKPQVHETKFYVEKDMYNLDAVYPDDNNSMLPGTAMDLPVTLHHEWRHSDQEMGGEDIEDFSLELIENENGELIDYDFLKDVSFIQKDGKTYIHVESTDGENRGETSIRVRASIKNEQGELVPVAENEFYFDVCDGYDYISVAEEASNPPVGGTLDLNSLGISTWRVNGDQKTERNDVVYTLELDENLWYVHPSQDGTFPLLTRMKDYGTNIALIANIKNENGGLDEICRRDFWFDELDYSVWFENLREEGGTYVFNNEEDYVLQLNTENLADKKDKEEALYRIGWEVGTRSENDGDQLGTIDAGFWKVDAEDASKLHVNGKVLAEVQKNLQEGQWIEIRVYVGAGAPGTDGIKVFEQRAGIYSRDAIEDYQYPSYGTQMFKGNRFWLSKDFNCYVENSEYPSGEPVPCKIKGIKIESLEEDDPEPSVSYEEKDDGYLFTGDKYGGTRVTVTYEDIHGDAQTHTFDIWVHDTIYSLEAEFETGWQMLKGESQKISFKVYKEVQGEDGNTEKTEVPSNEYYIEMDGGVPGNLASIEMGENKAVVQATKSEDEGQFGVGFRAVSRATHIDDVDQKDYPDWDAYTDINISVRNLHYNVQLEGWDDNGDIGNKVGSVVDLNQYNPIVKYAGLDPETGEKFTGTLDNKNVRWRVEYDSEKWERTPATAEQDIPALVRISGTETQIVLVAQELHSDRYGNEFWEDVAEEEIHFDRILNKDQDVTISELRDPEFSNSWIYNNEISMLNIKIRIQTDKMPEIIWSLYGYRGNEKIMIPGDNYAVSEDGTMLTLYGAKLWEIYQELGMPGALWVQAEVKMGDELIGVDEAAVFVRQSEEACDHQWKDETVTNPTCGADGVNVQRCEICGDTRDQVLPATGAHTWGEWTVTKAATCTVAGVKEAKCAVCSATKTEAIPATGAHTWGQWVVTKAATCTVAGVKEAKCAVCGSTKTEVIPATGVHTWGQWTVTKEATYVDAGEQTRACSVCGAAEKAQTEPYVLPIKRNQKVSLVIPLASKDSIKSVASSNKKIVAVKKLKKNTIQLKASKKSTGKVVITIVTAKKQKKTIQVNVQKGSVAAWSLTGVPEKVTLKLKPQKKKVYQLKPVVTPVTCKTKVTYSSSNKKVATVSKTGKITAKKAGTAVITVKVGKKISAKCIVTVKKK